MPSEMSPQAQPRVLVTGGSGFLGRQVLSVLEQRGYQHVLAPRRADYDLTDAEQVQACIRDIRPDAIVHLAAIVGGIGANMARPGDFFYLNLAMGANLIEQSRLHGVKKFVAIGTICAYPKFTPVPFKEDDLWNGYPEETNAPYGLAKKMLLVQAQAYRQQFGFNTIYLLPTNLYGPGDNFDPATSHVIPGLIRKCLEAQETRQDHILAWGTGKPTREFLFVRDCAEGIVAALERFDGPEPVNLGSGEEISIADLARLVAHACGFEGEIRFDASKPDGQPRRKLDTTRAKQLFGWQSQTSFDEGLRATIDWYRQVKRAQQPVYTPPTAH
ncbi:MAG TPA: GDP-L-fucose synthase [Chloroflexota bacterium]|nr:GDP-L-fucose synthase [Chloroflexota bacterium]